MNHAQLLVTSKYCIQFLVKVALCKRVDDILYRKMPSTKNHAHWHLNKAHQMIWYHQEELLPSESQDVAQPEQRGIHPSGGAVFFSKTVSL